MIFLDWKAYQIPALQCFVDWHCFLHPSKSTDQNLLEWKDAQEGVPWGVLLLFGGGLSLAAAAQSTGLAAWIGNLMPLGLSMALDHHVYDFDYISY